MSKIDAIAAYTNELERLLLTISPILSQHVMVSREHTEQEVISLTNRFANMVNELQQIVESTDNTLSDQQHNHLDNISNISRDLLQPVLELLKQIHQVEHSVIGELKQLSGHMSGLNAIADEVHSLAGQINQLADSAASEAALAGGHEQGLATVADGIRKLTDSVTQIDARLSNQIGEVLTVLNAALKISESSVQIDESALLQAESNINQTLSHLGVVLTRYRDDACALRNNADQIRIEISNVLVSLQFQDRVSQILTQVENNLLNLKNTIEKIQQQGSNRDGNMLQVDEAVEHIEENYKSVGAPPNRESDGSDDDLTFF